jgi:hypothetical protein
LCVFFVGNALFSGSCLCLSSASSRPYATEMLCCEITLIERSRKSVTVTLTPNPWRPLQGLFRVFAEAMTNPSKHQTSIQEHSPCCTALHQASSLTHRNVADRWPESNVSGRQTWLGTSPDQAWWDERQAACGLAIIGMSRAVDSNDYSEYIFSSE